jgi:hypothetical protein
MELNPTRSRKTATQNQKDRLPTQYRLRNFVPEHCRAKPVLTQLFGDNINGTDWTSLALAASTSTSTAR